MQTDVFQDEYAKYWLEDGILYVEYTIEVLDLEAARKSVQNRHERYSDKSYPLLIDIQHLKSVTKDARDYLSQGMAVNKIIAAALIANSLVAKLMFNFFLSFSKPQIPVRMFNSSQDGLNWLKQFKESAA